jgi:hypothetical protein
VVSWVLGLSYNTLVGWDKGFDDGMRPYKVSDKRGMTGKVTIGIVRQVVDKARELKGHNKRLRLKEFTRHLNQDLGLNLSRKTVQEILIANDLWQAETRRRRPRFYQNLCQRIPNGLLSLDGSELVVWIHGEPVRFNVELGVDVRSFCHTAFAIHPTETAAAVLEVMEQHCRDWGVPVGVLSDHGSANLSNEVRQYLQARDIELVAVGPCNPKGNGTDEGAFSQMKSTIGPIVLDTSSAASLAKSVLRIVISVYVKMRNRLALRRNGTDPVKDMQTPVSESQRQRERQKLLKHKGSRNPADINQPKVDQLHWIVKYHGLELGIAELHRGEQCIRHYDMEIINKAQEAFLKAVNRNPGRRSLAYFFGILRNMQQEHDDQEYQSYCRARYNHELMLENQRRAKEQEQLQGPPTVEGIVEMAAAAVGSAAHCLRETAVKWCKRWIEELIKSVGYIVPLKKKFIDAIGAMKHLDETQKESVWKLVEQLLDEKTQPESVTCIS